jgi:predicted neutral ceramidase superfamily lipid hydrolase
VEKIILAILSLIIWPVGIVLFFVTKNKKDAQLYLILGIIGLVFFGGMLFR